ncbi:MAG: Ig-like domain-containing protein [Cyclobacteriaceae bacterium]
MKIFSQLPPVSKNFLLYKKLSLFLIALLSFLMVEAQDCPVTFVLNEQTSGSAYAHVAQTFTATCDGYVKSIQLEPSSLSGAITNGTIYVFSGNDGNDFSGTSLGELNGVTITAAQTTYDLSSLNILLSNTDQITVMLSSGASGMTGSETFFIQRTNGDEDAGETAWFGTNPSGSSNELISVLEIDGTAPSIDGAGSTPNDDATDGDPGNDIVVDFDEDIIAGSAGSIDLRLVGGSSVETFDITTEVGSVTPGAGEIGIVGDKLYINPTSNLDGNTAYSIQYPVDILEDAVGNGVAAVSDDVTYNFTTTADPILISALYDVLTGNLVVTGTGFVANGGSDVDVTGLTLTGQTSGTRTLTVATTDPAISSDTEFTVVIAGADKTAVDALLNANGTDSDDLVTYNLDGADGWMPGFGGNEADAIAGITVSNIVPLLSNVSTAPVSNTGVDLLYQSDEAGTMYYVIRDDATVVLPANVVDASGANVGGGSGSFAVTALGSIETENLTVALIDGTTYYISIVVQSGGTNSIVSTSNWVADNAPPTVTSLDIYDTDFDGFIDRIDIVFDDIIDTDDGVAPGIADFNGGLLLPDGTVVASGTVSDPGVSPTNTVQITGISDQVTANTASNLTAISDLTGLWADDAGNLITAAGDDGATVNDNAAPALLDAAFYDDAPATRDGLIDRIVFTWSEATFGVGGLDATDFGVGVVLPDGNTASFAGATLGGDGSTSMNVTGITGQVSPATSTLDIYTAGSPATFNIDGITNGFTDGANTTSNPDDNETHTDVANPILIGSVPVDDAPSVGLTSNISFAFSENVDKETGNVTIIETGVGNHVAPIDVTTGSVTGGGNDTIVVVVGTPFIITTNYHVLADATTFDDPSGNSWDGIPSDATVFNFTTTSADLGPGDLAFTGYDENVSGDAFMIVLLRDFDGSGTPITVTFTDEEYSGTSFGTGEGYITWTISTLIPAGTEILFTNLDGGSTTATITGGPGGTAPITGSFNLANSDEGLWAIIGPRTAPEAFLSAISTAQLDDFSSLSGTGLDVDATNGTSDDFYVLSQTADADFMRYSTNTAVDRRGENDFANFWTKLRDESGNWATAGNGSFIGTTLLDFAIDDDQPLVASIVRNTPSTSPTNADVISWDVTFSDLVELDAVGTSVTNVDMTDFTLTGPTGATIGVTGSGLAYTVTASGGDIAGLNNTVTLGFSGGQDIQDAVGNILDVAGSTPTPNDNTFVVDNAAPIFVAPFANTLTVEGFTLNVQQNEIGTIDYVIVPFGDTAPTAQEVDDLQASGGGAPIQSGTIVINPENSNTTEVITSLTSATMYDVWFIGFDEAGNRQVTPTQIDDVTTLGFDMNSNVLVSAGGEDNAIDYTAHQETTLSDVTGVNLMNILVTDAGSADGVPTILESLDFSILNDANLKVLALFDGTNKLDEVTGPFAGTVSFTSLGYSVANGNTTTGILNLRGSFQAAVTDNQQVQFTITGATDNASGSKFGALGGGSSSVAGSDNLITVSSTIWGFAQQPTDVTIGEVMAPAVVVIATDALGQSIDVDYAGTNPSITSNFTMSPVTIPVTIVSGSGTVGAITHTTSQGSTQLTAAESGAPFLTNGTSDLFTVRPLDTDSDIRIVAGGETSDIDYASHQDPSIPNNTVGVSLATIRIDDQMSGDLLPTILDQLDLSITNDAYLRRLALYDGAALVQDLNVAGPTISFTNNVSTADGAMKTLTLRGTFIAAVVDNQKVSFTITGATAQTGGSSVFGAITGGTTSISNQDNQIEVTADRLAFSSITTAQFFDVNFSATVEAQDANANIDLDNTATITIAKNSGPSNLTGTVTSLSLGAGTRTYSDLQFDNLGGLPAAHTLIATDDGLSLTQGISGAITITTPDTDSRIDSSPTLNELAVVLNSTSTSSPGQDVFDFLITDLGTSDLVGTLITGVTFRQGVGPTGTSTELLDWQEVFQGAQLTDGINTITGVINPTSIVFSSIPTTAGLLGEVPDNTNKTYTLSVWVRSSFGGTVSGEFDDKFIEFLIDDPDITTGLSSSTLDVGGAVNLEISSTQIDTEVTSDRLALTAVPSQLYVDFPFSIEVSATDINGNVDLDDNSNVTISKNSGLGTLTGTTGPIALFNGVFTWTDLQVDMFDNSPGYHFNVMDNSAVVVLPVNTGAPIPTVLPDATSSIAAIGGEQIVQIEAVGFDGSVGSLNTSNAESVYTFSVTDAGPDGIPTIINQVRVDVIGGSPVAELKAIGIFDGSTQLGSSLAASNTVIALSPPITVADGASANFDVYVSFADTYTDNQQFQFRVADANFTQPGTASSTVDGSSTLNSSTAGNRNEINVTATNLTVTSIDDPVTVDVGFDATVEARDIKDNIDLDFAETITATTETGAGTVGGTATISPGAGTGVYTWSGGTQLQLDDGGFHNIRFRATTTTAVTGTTATSSIADILAIFNTSDIVIDPGFTFPTFFNYTQYDESSNAGSIVFASGESLVVGQYLVRDGGAGNDTDGLGTQISAIQFSLDTDAQNDIASLALFTGGGTQLGVQQGAGATVTFSGFTDLIADTDDQTYVLKATFNQNGSINDGDQHQYTVSSITGDNELSSLSGIGNNSPGLATPTAGNVNTIDVVSDRINFTVDPGTGAPTYERFSETIGAFTVQAQDINGNRDTDETSTLNITGQNGAGGLGGVPTIGGGSTMTLVSGQDSHSITIDSEHENLELVISDADGTAGSRSGSTTLSNNGVSLLIDVYDTTSPTIVDPTGVDLVPFDGETGVSLTTADLTITFSEDVVVNPSGGVIVIEGNTSPITEQIILDIATADVAVAGNVVTLDFPGSLTSGVTYYVIIPANTFNDNPNNNPAIGGNVNGFAGYTADTDWNWDMETVLTIQATSVAGNQITLEFNENVQISGSAVTTLGYFAVTDQGGAGAAQSLVSITDNSTGDDELEINLTNIATAVGDLEITYVDLTGGASPGVAQDGIPTNELDNLLAGSGPIVDIDNVSPLLTGASEFSLTELYLFFDEDITITTNVPTDFVVTDGQGTPFLASGLTDDVAADMRLELDIANLSSAVGNLTVTYNQSTSLIEDFGSNALNNGLFATIVRDVTKPKYISASQTDANHINVTFDEDVQTNGTNPTDFTVTDGAGNSYVVFVQSDGAANDTDIELLTADMTNALGNLTVTYTNSNNEISDFGGNVADGDVQSIILDVVQPTFVSAVKDNDTQITVTFDQPVQPVGAGTVGFTIVDADGGPAFPVTVQADGSVQDNDIVLTVGGGLSTAVGDIFVSYTDPGGGNDQIVDFAGNVAVSPVSNITIDLDFLALPDTTENVTPTSAVSWYEPNNVRGDNLFMYRTQDGLMQPNGQMPIRITPKIDQSTITVYDDAGLTNAVITRTNVSSVPGTGTTPTVADFMTGSFVDFSGDDDSGVFTFYITETAIGGATPSEGPAIKYSIALLDSVRNSQNSSSFGAEDAVGTSLQLTTNQPDQSLLFTGDGLVNISYNNTTTFVSDADFVPFFATAGSRQVSLSLQNDTTGVTALFSPPELAFVVTEISAALDAGQTKNFAQNGGAATILLNQDPANIDVFPFDVDGPDPDFQDVEVYYILNGVPNTVLGLLGTAPNGVEAGVNGGDIGGGDNAVDINSVLSYTPGTPIDGLSGVPINVDGASWSFNPSQFRNYWYTTAPANVVDTLRFVGRSQADIGKSLAKVTEGDVYLFPVPAVTVTTPALGTVYCEDESVVNVEANIFTYNGTLGVDSTGLITNGYMLYFLDVGGSGIYEFLADSTAGGSSGVVNTFDPTRINEIERTSIGKALGVGAGSYRIDYTSLPQTVVGTIGSGSVFFEVREVPSPPILEVSAASDLHGGLDDNMGSPSLLDDRYIFEYCSGETVEILDVDENAATGTPADGVNTEYYWYDFTDQSLVFGPSQTLSPDILFGISNPSGNITEELYVTRIVNGCESDSVRVTIRIFNDPDTPDIDETADPDIFANGIDEYYFEYCSDNFTAFDNLILTNNLADPDGRFYIENRNYFEILDADKMALPSIGYIPGSEIPGYLIDLNSGPYMADNSISGSPSGITSTEYFIVKHVADSTFSGGTAAQWDGCKSDTVSIFTRIYTVPQVPAFNDFTGNVHDLNGDGSVVQYYMCRNDDLDLPIDVGLNVPSGTSNFVYEWFEDAGAVTPIVTDDREGERLSLNDLNNIGFQEDIIAETSYTYYVRLNSNINEDSGFGGCTTSGLKQVNITVFPDVLEPQISLGAAPDLLSISTDVGNFDFEFNFCVTAGEGLDPNTEFQTSFSSAYAGSQGEILEWFPANANGDGLIGTSIISKSLTEAPIDPSYMVTANELRIQNTENESFEFAVIYNTERVPGFTDFTGCFSIDTAFVRVNVSTIPATEFTFTGITEDPTSVGGTIFDFDDPNNSAIAPGGVVFVLKDDNGTIINGSDPLRTTSTLPYQYNYSFPSHGLYDGELTITTVAGCTFTEIRRFQILEKIVVTGSYTEDFDGVNAGGWFEEFQLDGGLDGSLYPGDTTRISSWKHGVPTGTNIDGTYDNKGSAWSTTGMTELDEDIDDPANTILTNDGSYVGGEQSFVYSPSFDISSLLNPAILIRTFRDFDGIKDGVVFQFSVDDGDTWSALGDYNLSLEFPSSGQNWYNESAISSAPGGISVQGGSGFNAGRVGWADQEVPAEGWVESTHALTIADRTNIRFRFALGASGAFDDAKSGNGFAFDGMEIFDLGRTVLIEQFSSSISDNSKTVNDSFLSIDPLVGIDDDQVMWLNYFTDFVNDDVDTDPVNARNSVDPGARATYYGVDDVPKSVLDGVLFEQKSQTVRSWATNDVNIAALAPAFFEFPEITNTVSVEGTLSVDVTFTSKDTLSNADFSFVLAIVEKRVAAANFGGIGVYTANTDTLRNVVRVLLPGPAGWNYVGRVDSDPVGNPDESVFNYSIDWVITNVYDESQLRVIAFAQDNETKEILQSGFLDVPTPSNLALGLGDERSFSVYPNPSDDQLNIEFKSALDKENNWILYDQTGKEILTGIIEKGSKLFSLNTEKVPSGMYFINIYSELEHQKVARVVIVH